MKDFMMEILIYSASETPRQVSISDGIPHFYYPPTVCTMLAASKETLDQNLNVAHYSALQHIGNTNVLNFLNEQDNIDLITEVTANILAQDFQFEGQTYNLWLNEAIIDYIQDFVKTAYND